MEVWALCVIVPVLIFGIGKTFSWTGQLSAKDGIEWPQQLVINLYIWLTISSCYSSILFTLGLIKRKDGLSTVCHSCRFSCQQSVLKRFPLWLYHLHGWDSLSMIFTGKFLYIAPHCPNCEFGCQRVLKTFPATGYLFWGDGIVSLWHQLVNLYLRLSILSCFDSIPLASVLLRRHVGLSTLCDSCWFSSQQRVLEIFGWTGLLCFEDAVVWRSFILLNLCT